MKKNVKIALGGIILLLIGVSVFIGIQLWNQPIIEFYNKNEKVEIKSEIKPNDYIKKIHGYEMEDIVIDDSEVNLEKLGTYVIQYKINDNKYELKLEVVDTQAPTFDIHDLDIDLGMSVNVEDMVESVKDQTKTKVSFKEDYSFQEAGEHKVIVAVEDEAGNITEKEAIVNIVKDEEKPALTGLKDLTVALNGKIDYLSGIKAIDNRDPKPKMSVDSSQVNLKKVGTYSIQYTVIDRSGNQNTYTKKISVVENKPVATVGQNGNKVVYLTFDDGPSSNTAKILKVLDQYNVKATFFVTGNGQKYNYLIKEAHNKGHTIGLHTYTHSYSKVYASVNAYFSDLDKIGQMVKQQIGFVPKYIRFPGGASNTVSRKYCKGIMSNLTKEVQNRGYQYYDWNASTGDASGNNIAVKSLVKQGTASKANNIMILAHDTQAKSTTVEALPQIIEHYQSLGYVFKGIDDNTFTPHQHVNN
ncbi:polysaccharide deacetylase [Candidatus Stoquefichus massiliensis]|uniref:polysaccharide deacetylase n=1 Tax=Candidatus Stoquefichus massiliensis TaxID=1470350 RepID=UPI000486ECD1|nr:polysaccharide deacetylase [Candidatus Stoquefichus massiliensis]